MGLRYIISITTRWPAYRSIVKNIPETKNRALVMSDIGVRMSGINAVILATKNEIPKLKNCMRINNGTTNIACQ